MASGVAMLAFSYSTKPFLLLVFSTIVLFTGIVGSSTVFAQTNASIPQGQINGVLQEMTNLGLNSTTNGVGADLQCASNETAVDYIDCKNVIGTKSDLHLGGQVTYLKVSVWTSASLAANYFQSFYNSYANPSQDQIFYAGHPQVEKFDVGSGNQAFDSYDIGGSEEDSVTIGSTDYEVGLAVGEFQCGVITGYIEQRNIIPQSFIDLHNNSNETDTQRSQAYYAERMQLRADAAPIAKDWLTKAAQALSSSNLCSGASASTGQPVYGKITDKFGRPLRDVQVGLFWNSNATDLQITNYNLIGNYTYTNSDGTYRIDDPNIAVPMQGHGFIKVRLVDGNNWIQVIDDHRVDNATPVWFPFPSNTFTVSSASDLQHDIAFLPTDNTSFMLNDSASLATVYVDTYNALGFYRDKLGFSDFIQPLKVETFAPVTCGACFFPTDVTPAIKMDSTVSAEVGVLAMNKEYHEFGHYMTQLTFGGQSYFFRSGSPHKGFINPDSKDSWMEGLAEFLGQVTYNSYLPDPTKYNPNAQQYAPLYRFGPTISYYNDLSVIEPINRTELDNQNGTTVKVYNPLSEEFAVASILWSLYSPYDDVDGAKTQLKFEDMWNIITGTYQLPNDVGLPEARHIQTLSDLYTVLTSPDILSKYNLDKTEIDTIFLKYKILTYASDGSIQVGIPNPSGGPLPTDNIRASRANFPIPEESAVLINSDPSVLPYKLTVNTVYDPPYDGHNNSIEIDITQPQQKVYLWLPTSTIYSAKAVLTGSKDGSTPVTIATIDNTYYDTHLGASANLAEIPTVTLQAGSSNNQYVGAQSQTTQAPSPTTPAAPPQAQSFTSTPDVVNSFLSGNSIVITNQNTNSQLANYITMQSVPDKYAQQVLGIQGQFVTTVAYQDRYGRPESNNNLNVFLQLSHTTDKINSMRGVELGGDSIMTNLSGVSGSTSLVNSAEIQIPQGSAGNVPQKIRDTLNAAIEPANTPQPVLDFLNNNIDLVNKVTGDHLTHYILVQTVPDLYAQKVLNIQGQYVSTLAFEDRYGRQDSNGNLNVFLQISHTADQVNSIRGIQLGGDDIEVYVNGVDEGTITKTVEIPMSSSSTTQTQSSGTTPPTPQLGQNTPPAQSQPQSPAPTSQSANGYFKVDKSEYSSSANPPEMATITGKLNDPKGGTVVLTITKPDGTTEPISADVTNVGDFTTLVIIDESFPAGTYTMSGNYHGSDLGSITFTVR